MKIGKKVPVAIQSLIKKSPKLATLNYNNVDLQEVDLVSTVSITNRANYLDLKNAETIGYTNTEKMLQHRLKAMAKKERQL